MRDDTPSRTAAYVAVARGLGLLLPADVRLADDPYGVAFASPQLAKLAQRAPTRLAMMPGLREWILYMQVRTRLLDDAVRAFVDAGGTQVVLLGAGYDCRALRLPELADAAVFEVDHPATQGHKRATLEKLDAQSPARYVTWDFETRPMDDLPDALADAGHDPQAPTLTLWEGVTMYLTEPAIDASLRAIHAWSAPGSELGMTYFAKKRLAQPSFATRAIQAVVARLGEPWRWGWIPEELPAFMAARGWDLVDDIAMSDAARALLPPHLAAGVTDPDRRIALASTPEKVALSTPHS
jgi:methyltransferase (TIGR00027 family)